MTVTFCKDGPGYWYRILDGDCIVAQVWHAGEKRYAARAAKAAVGNLKAKEAA